MKFSFISLKKSDISQIFEWVHLPHVAPWYFETSNWKEFEEKYSKKLTSDSQFSYLVYADNTPIGYIQYYIANKVGGGWWPDAHAGTVGIDQFIGNPEYIGKGYGTTFIKQFIKEILFSQSWVTKVIVDVDPNNKRAFRCYEKVGFKEIGVINTPDGKAVLMEIRKKDF